MDPYHFDRSRSGWQRNQLNHGKTQQKPQEYQIFEDLKSFWIFRDADQGSTLLRIHMNLIRIHITASKVSTQPAAG